MPELCEHRQRIDLPRRIFEIRCLVPDPRLDRIQAGNPLQRLRRKSRFALRLRDFEEASTAMGPTSDLDYVSGFVECAMSTVRVRLQITFVLLQVPQRMRTGARFGELEHDRWRVVNPDAVLLALARAQVSP